MEQFLIVLGLVKTETASQFENQATQGPHLVSIDESCGTLHGSKSHVCAFNIAFKDLLGQLSILFGLFLNLTFQLFDLLLIFLFLLSVVFSIFQKSLSLSLVNQVLNLDEKLVSGEVLLRKVNVDYLSGVYLGFHETHVDLLFLVLEYVLDMDRQLCLQFFQRPVF